MPAKITNVTPKAAIICFIAALFYGFEYLVRIEPSVMIPMLLKYYQTDAFEISGLGSVYYYAYMPMQLVVGVLLDRYYPHKILIFASLSVVVGLVLFALSETLLLADISRFLIGLGGAFALLGALKIGTIWLPARVFSFYLGLVLAMGMFGAIVADLVLTHAVTDFGWENTTYIIAFLGLIMAVLIILFVRDKDATHEITTHTAITKQDFIDVISHPQQWINAIIAMLLFLPISVFAGLWGIPFLETVYGYSHDQSGQVIATLFFGMLIGAPLVGHLSERLGSRKLLLSICCIAAGVFISLLLYNPHLSPRFVYLVVFLYAAFSGAISLNFVIAREIAHDRTAGTAMAFTNMMSMLGGVLALPLIGIFLVEGWDGTIVHGVMVYPAIDYQLALTMMPVGLFLAAICTIFLKETYHSRA